MFVISLFVSLKILLLHRFELANLIGDLFLVFGFSIDNYNTEINAGVFEKWCSKQYKYFFMGAAAVFMSVHC